MPDDPLPDPVTNISSGSFNGTIVFHKKNHKNDDDKDHGDNDNRD